MCAVDRGTCALPPKALAPGMASSNEEAQSMMGGSHMLADFTNSFFKKPCRILNCYAGIFLGIS